MSPRGSQTWRDRAQDLANELTVESLRALCHEHRLQEQVCRRALLGWDDARRCWTLPVYGRDGAVIGIRRRFQSQRECSAMGSSEGFMWAPTAFGDRGLVVMTSGILNVLATASAGIDGLGLVSDSAAATATVSGLALRRDVLVLASAESRLRIAENVAERLSPFAACIRVAVCQGGPAAFLRESTDLAGFWEAGQGVRCRIEWRSRRCP